MEEYIGIVAERDGDTYITPRSGHIAKKKNNGRQTYLVKVDYNGNIIGEEPVGKILPGLRLSLKAIFDRNMRYLATPHKLYAGTEKNIGVGPGKDLSTIVRDLQPKYQPQEKLAPAYAH